VPDPSVQPPGGLIRVVALKMCSDESSVFHGSDKPCQWCLFDASNVLAALFDACEVREQFGVRAEGVDDFWPYEPTHEWAEKAIASRAKRNWPASHLIRRCDLRTPPESVGPYPEKPRGR
jgi:hypothetical protein